MGLFILAETSAGYVLLKSRDKKLLGAEQSKDVSSIVEALKLKKFQKFDSAVTALEQAAALTDGKVTPMLSSLLEDLKEESKATRTLVRDHMKVDHGS
jgi:nucleolar protein 58